MLEPTQQWNKLFPFHAYQRHSLHLTHQDVEQGLDCSLCCKLLFWLQNLWADVILLLHAHCTSHHRTPSCQRPWGVTTKQNGSSVMPFIRAYISISYFSCVCSGAFSKTKKEILQCHVGVIRKWALYLWYVILGQKLVIWPIVTMTFEKRLLESLQGLLVTLPEICPHHYWIARSLTKECLFI